MGNYRFRLSDMIPNAWFYKLRDMSKTRSTQNTSTNTNSHKKKLPFPPQIPNKSFPGPAPNNQLILTSLDFDRTHSHNPPRKSFKKWAKRRTVYVPSPKKITPAAPSSSVCNIVHDPNHDFPTCNLHQGFQEIANCNQALWSSPQACKLTSSSTDIIIDVDKPLSRDPNCIMISEPKLPPILTRPKPPNPGGLENLQVRVPLKKTTSRSPVEATARKSVSRASAGGVRMNRAKVGGKGRRKSARRERKEMYNAERLAIVKSSIDPERDFKESMMEMIVENNIRGSKELEELLACYLSLNSNHYHHIIIKAFEQIWLN